MFVADRSPEDCNELCSFCSDRKADALWMGKIDIFACSLCAVEILPQLMADAIVGGTSVDHIRTSKATPHEIQKESRILERYHSAFSGALIRKLRIAPIT
ncbi:MAG: hypothetical protein ACREXR_00275 [Gammaproteobacteria bacterium]